MQPTQILMNEHRIIEQVLNCLEKIAAQAAQTKTLDRSSAEEVLDFFRNFADRCHHGKEEQHLFPMLEAKGFPREGGPTGVMLYEHDLGRKHLRAMTAAVQLASPGNREGPERFAHHARAYIQLLRDHIAKEDHCLFPMAERALSADDNDRLTASFARTEHEDMGEGTHEKYLEIADTLAERFHVSKASGRFQGEVACGACGHSR